MEKIDRKSYVAGFSQLLSKRFDQFSYDYNKLLVDFRSALKDVQQQISVITEEVTSVDVQQRHVPYMHIHMSCTLYAHTYVIYRSIPCRYEEVTSVDVQ